MRLFTLVAVNRRFVLFWRTFVVEYANISIRRFKPMQNLTMGWRGKVAYVFPSIMIMRNLKNTIGGVYEN